MGRHHRRLEAAARPAASTRLIVAFLQFSWVNVWTVAAGRSGLGRRQRVLQHRIAARSVFARAGKRETLASRLHDVVMGFLSTGDIACGPMVPFSFGCCSQLLVEPVGRRRPVLHDRVRGGRDT